MVVIELDRFELGIFLAILGGLLSIFNLSLQSPNRHFATLEEFTSWYVVGVGLSLMVLAGAILAYKRHIDLGAILVLIPSILSPIWLLLFVMFSRPEGVIARVLYQALADSGWLIFSLVGGILIVTSRLKGESET